jgi:tRNA G18 (ribose-2'-O)-methylase SpoU
MIFILENIRSKFNIGSIFRISDCFWVKEIILTGFSKYPPDLEISKTAIWAENVVKWRYFQNSLDAVNFLKEKWKKIISMEIWEKTINLKDYKFSWNEVFIFWNEITWVSKEILEICDEVLEIPMKWKIKESLNVSICAGIVGFSGMKK